MNSSVATSTSVIPGEKNHYLILDGLRGVASLGVVIFHLLEPFSGDNAQGPITRHGYLAVDFFFFHDVLKAGEVTTLPQYMTGVLSLAVFAICAQSLLKSSR